MAKKAKQNAAKQALPPHAYHRDQALVGWYAPEYLRFERGWLWYFLAMLVDGALILYALWSQSWTMMAVFVLLPVIYLLEHRKRPEVVEVVISKYGIRYGKIKIPYSDIRRFWILHEPPYVDELHLLTNHRWHSEITIPLMGVDPSKIRHYLVTQVPEWEGKSPSFLDSLVRFLRLN